MRFPSVVDGGPCRDPTKEEAGGGGGRRRRCSLPANALHCGAKREGPSSERSGGGRIGASAGPPRHRGIQPGARPAGCDPGGCPRESSGHQGTPERALGRTQGGRRRPGATGVQGRPRPTPRKCGRRSPESGGQVRHRACHVSGRSERAVRFAMVSKVLEVRPPIAGEWRASSTPRLPRFGPK